MWDQMKIWLFWVIKPGFQKHSQGSNWQSAWQRKVLAGEWRKRGFLRTEVACCNFKGNHTRLSSEILLSVQLFSSQKCCLAVKPTNLPLKSRAALTLSLFCSWSALNAAWSFIFFYLWHPQGYECKAKHPRKQKTWIMFFLLHNWWALCDGCQRSKR